MEAAQSTIAVQKRQRGARIRETPSPTRSLSSGPGAAELRAHFLGEYLRGPAAARYPLGPSCQNQNGRSYRSLGATTTPKFALGQALLDLGARQQTFVRLEDLAVPYAAAICEHLQVEDRQSTSAQSSSWTPAGPVTAANWMPPGSPRSRYGSASRTSSTPSTSAAAGSPSRPASSPTSEPAARASR